MGRFYRVIKRLKHGFSDKHTQIQPSVQKSHQPLRGFVHLWTSGWINECVHQKAMFLTSKYQELALCHACILKAAVEAYPRCMQQGSEYALNPCLLNYRPSAFGRRHPMAARMYKVQRLLNRYSGQHHKFADKFAFMRCLFRRFYTPASILFCDMFTRTFKGLLTVCICYFI